MEIKPLFISFCEDYPHLDIAKDENDNIEIYICTNSKIMKDNSGREVDRSDKMQEEDPIFIPEWCPLEECTMVKRIVDDY